MRWCCRRGPTFPMPDSRAGGRSQLSPGSWPALVSVVVSDTVWVLPWKVFQLTLVLTCLMSTAPEASFGSVRAFTVAVTVYVKRLRLIVQVDPVEVLASPGIACELADDRGVGDL